MKTIDQLQRVGKRAVLYGRVSGDDRGKEGRNLTSQLEMGREFAQANGYNVVVELPEDDRGASGAAIDLPQLNRVREMAQAGEFDVLVVRELDRLSRNLAKQLIVEEELKRCGVGIEYVIGDYDDTPEGRLNKHIRATIAEYEREKIRERMTRGKRNIAKGGKVIAAKRPLFGYDLVDGYLVINPDQAEVVLLIYSLYLDGNTIEAIRRYLNGSTIPTPADFRKYAGVTKKLGYGQWGRATIRNILSNSAYAGTWYWGKRKKGKKVAGKWGTVNNDKSTWIAVDIPAIIAPEVFSEVQMMLGENAQRVGRPNSKVGALFSKRVACGDCGYKIRVEGRRKKGVVQYAYYVCPSHRNKDLSRECSLPYFRVDLVDTKVWEWLETVLLDEKALRRGWENYQIGLAHELEPVKIQLAIAGEKRDSAQGKLDALLDLHLDGHIDKETFVARKSILQKEANSLDTEMHKLSRAIGAKQPTPAQFERIEKFIAQIKLGLEKVGGKNLYRAKLGIVKALDVTIELRAKKGQRSIYAQCVLRDNDSEKISTIITSGDNPFFSWVMATTIEL